MAFIKKVLSDNVKKARAEKSDAAKVASDQVENNNEKNSKWWLWFIIFSVLSAILKFLFS